MKSIVEELEVVTPPDRPAGRHLHLESVPLKKAALSDGINVHHVPSDWQQWKVPATKTGKNFSMAVVVSFGYLIPTFVLEHFNFRAINMHPSLLPRHRGAAPIHHTILQRDSETGVSIIQLSANKFDAGKILLQRKTPVQPDITYAPLAQHLADMGANAVMDVLGDFEQKLCNAIPQDPTLVTKAPKVRKEDGVLRFDLSADEVYTRWRAFVDNIGTYSWVITPRGRIRTRFLKLAPAPTAAAASHKRPGEVSFVKEQRMLHIACKEGGGVYCSELQLAGKAMQTAVDFANGFLKENNTVMLSMKEKE